MNHFWEMSSTRKCRSDEGSDTLQRDNYFFFVFLSLVAVYRNTAVSTYLPIGVITVAISYSTHCNNFIAAPREFAKPGGRGGLACRKTIVVTVTVISNGVEIAITTGTYIGYTVYVQYVCTAVVLSVNVPLHYAGKSLKKHYRHFMHLFFFPSKSRWTYYRSAYVGIWRYRDFQGFIMEFCRIFCHTYVILSCRTYFFLDFLMLIDFLMLENFIFNNTKKSYHYVF